MIVGEGGLAPEYFLYKMQWWEINQYLAGMHRRYHATYRAARMLQWWMVCMWHGKDTVPPSSSEKMYKFAWEEEEEELANAPIMTEEEAQNLQKEMEGFQW